MAKRRRYYLGRVHKMGQLDDSLLIQSFTQPAVVHLRDYAWTFTDASVVMRDGEVLYAYGQLCKFNPSGEVRVVDEAQAVQDVRPEPNLLVAASPFVYVPAYSGLAYQHVWNHIERETFLKRFSDIVRESHDSFFVDCEVEPITDLQTFAVRLKSIESFTEIRAKVHPPNPLFGRAWKELKDYLAARDASELSIKEKGDESAPLRTSLPESVAAILAQDDDNPFEPDRPLPITDAAVLMAADGYGSGKVIGRRHGVTVILNTSETQLGFLSDAEIDAEALYEQAVQELSQVSSERRMEHP